MQTVYDAFGTLTDEQIGKLFREFILHPVEGTPHVCTKNPRPSIGLVEQYMHDIGIRNRLN